MADNNETSKNENDSGCGGCLLYLAIWGGVIYEIVNIISNRNVTGYGFWDIVKYSAIWIAVAFIVCLILDNILSFYKRLKKWENNEFKDFCSNRVDNEKMTIGKSEEIERNLKEIETKIQQTENRLNEVKKMGNDVK